MKRKPSLPQMIREAVHTYPGGICFAMETGRPILVNRKINELVSQLTGHTILNAFLTWEDLEAARRQRDLGELRTPLPTCEQGDLSFFLEDGSIWRFRKQILRDGKQQYVQIEATDVTELYRKSQALAKSNQRLQDLASRQHRLLTEIVQINREKELLQAKMRVHAELGRCLIITKKALSEPVKSEYAKEIVESWEDAIRSLASIPKEAPMAEDAMEKELLKVARMIGCQIRIVGQRPQDLRTQQLLFAAMREAVTNAVRHGNATELLVTCEKSRTGYHAEISDNGKRQVDAIREGSGLNSLRQRLEREGATLEIQCEGGIRLLIDLPLGGETNNGEVIP